MFGTWAGHTSKRLPRAQSQWPTLMSAEAQRVGERTHRAHHHVPSHEQQVKKPLSTVDDNGGAARANVRVDPSSNGSAASGHRSVDEKDALGSLVSFGFVGCRFRHGRPYGAVMVSERWRLCRQGAPWEFAGRQSHLNGRQSTSSTLIRMIPSLSKRSDHLRLSRTASWQWWQVACSGRFTRNLWRITRNQYHLVHRHPMHRERKRLLC